MALRRAGPGLRGHAADDHGHFLSPEPNEWVTGHADIMNRLIAVTVSWISAALIMLQKATQHRLMEMQTRFRETFEQTAVGIAHVARDGSLLMSNHCFHEILGYPSANDLASKRLHDLVHPDDLRAYKNYIEQVMRGESRTRSIETRFFRMDGSIVWIDQTVSRVSRQIRRSGWPFSSRHAEHQRAEADGAVSDKAQGGSGVGHRCHGDLRCRWRRAGPTIEYVNQASRACSATIRVRSSVRRRTRC